MRIPNKLTTLGCLVLWLLAAPLASPQTTWVAPDVLDGAMNISAEELVDLRAEFKNTVVIDTMAHDDANPSSIEGAHTLPRQILSASLLTQLAGDKMTPLVFFGNDPNSIHCYKAARQAIIMGYTNVYWFRGGFKEWLNKGLPVVKVQ